MNLKQRILLIGIAVVALLAVWLIWIGASETTENPPHITTVQPFLPRQQEGAAPTASPTIPATEEIAASFEIEIDRLPDARLRKGMEAFLVHYPEEAVRYALAKIVENPDPMPFRNMTYATSVAYALAQSDRIALADYLAALPDNVRPYAAYAATARYVDDGDLPSAVASLTLESQDIAVMRVAELFAERNLNEAAAWADKYRGTNAYEMAVMPVIRSIAQTDKALAREWAKSMPDGSNRNYMIASLDKM